MATSINVTPYATNFQSTIVKVEEVPLAGLTGVTGTTGSLYAMRLVNGAGATRYMALENSGSFTANAADIMIPIAATTTMVVYIDIGATFDVAFTVQAATASDNTGAPGADVDATLFIS